MSDAERARPCVGSGHCCKQAPCAYGVWSEEKHSCAYLEPWPDDDLPVQRYRCGRYEEIIGQPGVELSPAFGAGCSSTLFNTARDRVLVELRRKVAELRRKDGDRG